MSSPAPIEYRDEALGYQLTLPSGLSGSTQPNGGYLAGGLVDGKILGVIVFPTNGAGELMTYLSDNQGKIVEERTRTVGEDELPSYIYDQEQMRCEIVLYQGKQMLGVAVCSQPVDAFADAMGTRDSLFESFKPGGSTEAPAGH